MAGILFALLSEAVQLTCADVHKPSVGSVMRKSLQCLVFHRVLPHF